MTLSVDGAGVVAAWPRMVAFKLPERPGVTTLVAVMTIALFAGTLAGAVYMPLAAMVPTVALPPATPLIDQVTEWLWAPVTVAEYWLCVPIVSVDGPVTVTVAVAGAACNATEMMPEIEESTALTAAMVIVPEDGIAAGAE